MRATTSATGSITSNEMITIKDANTKQEIKLNEPSTNGSPKKPVKRDRRKKPKGTSITRPERVVLGYCEKVLNDKIPSGIHMKNAVGRFLKDYEGAKNGANGFTFNWGKIKKVLKFMRQLKHFKGEWAGKPFNPEPWQSFIIANLYGFIRKDNGARRFNTAYIEVSRKNGKSALVAALSLYALTEEDESSPEILLAANSKDQARICWNFVDYFAKDVDPNDTKFRRYRNDLNKQDDAGFIKTLAADPTHLDGYDCHLGIVDEYHSAPNTLVRDVLRSSMGMRKNPLLLTITTAGYDKNLPCYELRQLATDIAAGIKKDETFFSAVFSLDEDDDWKDPSVWIKSNPNIGITVRESFIKDQINQAINSPSDEVGVRTKNLNQWCDTSKIWIPEEYTVGATREVSFKEFKDKDVYVGVDLASTVDLTAVSYLFYDEDRDKYVFKTEYYLPQQSLNRTNLHADKVSYKKWARTKYIKLTSGNVTDYNYITKDLLDFQKSAEINKVYYDKYNALQWAIQVTEEGIDLEAYSQTVANFNIPTRELERLILSNKVEIDNNPVTMYCFRNVELRTDQNGNIKPNRESEMKKIDGVISMIQALAALLDSRTGKGTGIY